MEIKSAKHPKSYSVEVEADDPVEEEKLNEVVTAFNGLTVDQRTPARVSHRRGDKVRKRRVLGISARKTAEKEFTLEITGQAGIYIKELVHGDGGRTVPSIAERLGTGCRVKALDVIAIHDYEEEE